MEFWENWEVTPKANRKNNGGWRKNNLDYAKEQERRHRIRQNRLLKISQMPSEEEKLLIENAVELTRIPGIYQLWLEGKRLYIGSSHNIPHREVLHKTTNTRRKIKFDKFTYHPYYGDNLEDVEYKLINYYQPPMNKLKLRHKR